MDRIEKNRSKKDRKKNRSRPFLRVCAKSKCPIYNVLKEEPAPPDCPVVTISCIFCAARYARKLEKAIVSHAKADPAAHVELVAVIGQR